MDLIRLFVEKVLRDKIFLALIVIGILGIFFTGMSGNSEHKGRIVSSDARNRDTGGRAGGNRDVGGDPGGDAAGDAGTAAGGQAGQQATGGQSAAPELVAKKDEGIFGGLAKMFGGAGSKSGADGAGGDTGGDAGGGASGAGKTGGGGGKPQLRRMTLDGQPGGQSGQTGTPAQAAPQANVKEACDFVRWWMGQAMNFTQATAAKSHKEALAYAKPAAAQVFTQMYWGPELAQAIASGNKAGSFELSEVTPIAANPDASVVIKCTGVLCMQDVGNPPQSQSLEFNFLVKREPEGYRVLNFFSQGGQVQSHGQQAQPGQMQPGQMQQDPNQQQQMQQPYQEPERRPYRPVY